MQDGYNLKFRLLNLEILLEVFQTLDVLVIMRMFMTGFNDPITIRFGALDLVRGEWRRYTITLDANETNTK